MGANGWVFRGLGVIPYKVVNRFFACISLTVYAGGSGGSAFEPDRVAGHSELLGGPWAQTAGFLGVLE